MTRTTAYPSDLSDARWSLIEPRLAAWRQARTDSGVGGRRPTHELREIFNAILYVNRTGIAWRYLPHDFPPHQSVYGYFTAWTNDGVFEALNHDLTGLARRAAGRDTEPSACIIDTQSVKTSTNAPAATQGIDAGKKIVGRKRGIVTDALGLLLAVVVTAASTTDNTIGKQLLDATKSTYPTITTTWADTGFKNAVIEHGATLGIDVQVVPRKTPTKGFTPVKRRWVVERTLGWILLHRRLARDYETHPTNSAAMIRIAMIDNLAKRTTGETTITWRDDPDSHNSQTS